MRVAPIGAYFAEAMDDVAQEASRSAQVTHSHRKLSAGYCRCCRSSMGMALRLCHERPDRATFLDALLPFIPESGVRPKSRRARDISERTSVESVAAMLGSGYAISAQDTVPFVLWCAGEGLADYEEALWLTVRGLGDMDTTCAMVGGIVALFCGVENIPPVWRQAREPLPNWPFVDAYCS